MGKYVVRKNMVLVSLSEFTMHADRLPNLPNIFDFNDNFLGEIIDSSTYKQSITKDIKALDYDNMYTKCWADITYK